MTEAPAPASTFKINKTLNGTRRKRRALSMEPMTSDAILKMLEATEQAQEAVQFSTPKKQPIRAKSVSSSAKRRRTLNGPPTQQDEDEVTVSQASGIVAESESENEIEDDIKEKMNEIIVIQDSQASQPSPAPQKSPVVLSGSSSTPTTSSGDFTIGTPDDDSSKKQPTARELRRRNRNSLSKQVKNPKPGNAKFLVKATNDALLVNSTLVVGKRFSARLDSNKENTLDKHMATPGSVSGFMRKHREVNSTPIPMAMSFSTRVAKSVDYAAGVTHLIVGKDTRRTIKVLFAIARGAWIVTEDWAFSSLDQERWLPEEDFEIAMFANKYSREHPESRQIFKGTKFFVGSNVEPSREVLQSLIQVAGGEICNQISVADVCICGDASLFRRAQRTGIRVVTSKWVFDSIATMKLGDDAKYAFTEAFGTPAKTPSSVVQRTLLVHPRTHRQKIDELRLQDLKFIPPFLNKATVEDVVCM
eukprot:jgi/Phyca11/533453/estExt2_fgenesh1_pg.C_PHYCAscaffold_140015